MFDEIERRTETSRTETYGIRIAGHLGSGWSDWFAGLRVTLEEGGDTLVVGPLDQAALHGVLRRVRDLGMPLISVTRVESGPQVAQPSIHGIRKPRVTPRRKK